MGFYANRIMPRLISAGMRNKAMAKHRSRVPALARGRVLEIGIGPGLNIPYYGTDVTHLFGLEPSKTLVEEAAVLAARAPFPVDLLAAGAEAIPLERHSVDTIVTTWTLCSVPALGQAFDEMRRVLRPGGQLLFLEHGRAPDASVARWQDRLSPLFRGLAGCRPNLAIDRLIEQGGFDIVDIETRYFDGPRFIAWHYIGKASPR